jgi:hypothetical protein
MPADSARHVAIVSTQVPSIVWKIVSFGLGVRVVWSLPVVFANVALMLMLV